MSQIPEDLMQVLIQMTRQSRANIEQMLQSQMQEQSGRQTAKSEIFSKGGAMRKPAYTQDEYPHYLPAARVQKYTLRITLRRITPAIWRKVGVPSNITLRHLGDLILDLMGWGGWHLNQFRKGNAHYMPYYQRESSGESNFVWDCENLSQEEYTIADLLTEKGRNVMFEYDFGDGWEHEVRLSLVNEYADGEAQEIVFIDGKRCCPPDDCGGSWGYEDLLELLSKRKAGKRLSSEERERLEWFGLDKNYNPEALDLNACKRVVKEFNEK